MDCTVSGTLSSCGMDLGIRQKETNKLQSINSHLSRKGDSQEEEDTHVLPSQRYGHCNPLHRPTNSRLYMTSTGFHIRWHFCRPPRILQTLKQCELTSPIQYQPTFFLLDISVQNKNHHNPGRPSITPCGLWGDMSLRLE